MSASDAGAFIAATSPTEAKLLEKADNHAEFNDLPTIEVAAEDLAEIIRENQRLRARETELLAKNSALVIENRRLRRYLDGGGERFSSLLRGQVESFMHAFDQPVREKPGIPSDKIVRLRARLILEEAFEFAEACCEPNTRSLDNRSLDDLKKLKKTALDIIAFRMNVEVDLPRAMDACSDLSYVVEGAFLSYGTEPQPVHDEVHRANMAKLGGGVDEHGKKLKPSGWTPPDIARVLAEQGWKP